MKTIISIFQQFILFIIQVSAMVGSGIGVIVAMTYFLEKEQILYAILSALLNLLAGIFIIIKSDIAKHNKCGNWGRGTRMGGSKYKQHYCETCEEKFFTKLWYNDGKDY